MLCNPAELTPGGINGAYRPGIAFGKRSMKAWGVVHTLHRAPDARRVDEAMGQAGDGCWLDAQTGVEKGEIHPFAPSPRH